MQFIAAASLFAAALAAPAPKPQTSDCPNPAHCGETSPTAYENIDITDFWLRKNNGSIESVSFKMTGDEAKEPILCSVGATPTFPSATITCDDGKSNYRVILTAPKDSADDVTISLYHQTGQASGLWQEFTVPAYCHAGGNVSEYPLNPISFP
jgi:hypothetical protein